jgi:WD40 repeat protein
MGQMAGCAPPRQLVHGGRINAAAISPDGTLVATAGQNRVARVWRLASGTFRVIRHDGPVSAVAFDSTGRVLATASGKDAYTWSTTGESLRTFQTEAEGSVTAVAFGNRDRLLATASDKYPKTWNAKTGQLRKTFVGHGSNVQGVAFSPDGRWFATVAARKAAIWQVGDSDLNGNFLLFVAPPLQQQKPLTSVAFSPDHTIVMGNSAGKVLSYRCRFCGRLPQLVTIAKRKLEHLRDEAHR